MRFFRINASVVSYNFFTTRVDCLANHAPKPTKLITTEFQGSTAGLTRC